MNYESARVVHSACCDGVCFRVARLSFSRRLDLTKRVRELGRRIEFDQAGTSVADRLEAAIAVAEIDRLYIEWGLLEIEGLLIDGKPADRHSLIEAGPEDLCREIVAEIRRECGLTDEERKN